MATLFPTALDVLANPNSADPLHTPSHANQHTNANDAIEALQSKVGINNSAVATSLDYRIKQLELNPASGNLVGLSDVLITSASNNDLLAYETSSGKWKNKTFSNLDLATKTYVDAGLNNLGNTLNGYVPIGDVGEPDGVASLDSAGKIPVAQLGNLIDGAPEALNTLNELAAALADDANYATTITNALALKAPLASPTFTGTVNLSSATVNGVLSTVQQNGTALSKRPTLNFVGGALIQDDLANNRINVTIAGGDSETYALMGVF